MHHAATDTQHVTPEEGPRTAKNHLGWVGAPWVPDVEGLDRVLRSSRRVWFVTDGANLQTAYSIAFRQQLLSRLEPAFETGNVYVLLSKPGPHVIPTDPEVYIGAELAGQVELVGFTLGEEALLTGTPALLTLFWKAQSPMDDYKAFVHLRDPNNQSVAQADHIPSEAVVALPTSTWQVGEMTPDVTFLTIPPDLPSGDTVCW